MSDDNKVVFLAHRRQEAVTDVKETLVCSPCRNRAWSVMYDSRSRFPFLQCTSCGHVHGYIGWISDREAQE